MSDVPKCVVCARAMAPYRGGYDNQPTMDGRAQERGYEGNNMTCSQRCGYELGRAVVIACPDVVGLLTPGWNAERIAKFRDAKSLADKLGQAMEPMAGALEAAGDAMSGFATALGSSLPLPPRRSAPCPHRVDGDHQWRQLAAGDLGPQITSDMRARRAEWEVCQPCGATRRVESARWIGRLDAVERAFFEQHRGAFDTVEELRAAMARRAAPAPRD